MQVELGKFNVLEVVKEVDFGVYLDGGESGEILLPTRYVPEDCEVGSFLSVFIYLDIEERLIATNLIPYVEVGQFAYLEVAWVNQFGAFLNWGLMKDLFVPFREQKMEMKVGRKYIIHAHVDEESYRIVASAKVERYLSTEEPPYATNDKVELLIQQKTDLGFKAIVDNSYSGLIYDNELFQDLSTGDRVVGYVKYVRPDGKIDLRLQPSGARNVSLFAERLLAYIVSNGGSIPFTDKSPADTIYDTFEVSKKTFKRAVGELYKHQKIVLEKDAICIAPSV